MNKTSKRICDETQCTGCMACENACPFQAITCKRNAIGNLVPQINEDFCRHCGICNHVCPQMTPCEKRTPLGAYAAYMLDQQDKADCASGGIATVISRRVIRMGGFVCGAEFDSEYHPVMSVVDQMDQLERLKGSKYVQCAMGTVYQEIERRLKAGQPGVFIGTPCQVAGVLNYLKKPYPMLLTADLICHGVPSELYLQEHLAKHTAGQSNGKLTFRGKYDFCLHLESQNGKVLYNKWNNEDPYFCAFLSGLTYRESCYSCRYAQGNRVSDLTLGDFWGVDRKTIGGYPGRSSLVLVNTEAGRNMLDACREQIYLSPQTMEDAKRENMQLSAPSRKHPDRDRFCESYRQSNSFEQAVRKTRIPSDVRRAGIQRKRKKLQRGIRKLKRILKIGTR